MGRQGRYNCSHFTNEKPETQRAEMICPRSHRKFGQQRNANPTPLSFKLPAFCRIEFHDSITYALSASLRSMVFFSSRMSLHGPGLFFCCSPYAFGICPMSSQSSSSIFPFGPDCGQKMDEIPPTEAHQHKLSCPRNRYSNLYFFNLKNIFKKSRSHTVVGPE